MAEVQRLGTMDPAAQKELLADLRQTDPSLWPLMLQQVQAANAYRNKADRGSKPDVAGNPLRASDAAAGGNLLRPQPAGEAAATPAAVAPALADSSPPPSKSPEAKGGALGPRRRSPPKASRCGDRPGGADVRTAPRPRLTGKRIWARRFANWKPSPRRRSGSDAEIARQAYLRTLWLLAGRRDDALAPIPGAKPAQQEFWSKELYAMQTWLDTDHNPDPARCAAETKRILGEAMLRLGETAPLVVHNLAFCTEVQGFGSITPFRKAEFSPNQELLLYAEVENFAVEPTPRGFHTTLRSSYQIFDARGQRVADQQLAASEDYCQSPRRDFFFGYRLRLPKRIYNGKYTLQLTTEDLKSHKVGQSSIDLVIKGGED